MSDVEREAERLWEEMRAKTDAPGHRDPPWDRIPEDWEVKEQYREKARALLR